MGEVYTPADPDAFDLIDDLIAAWLGDRGELSDRQRRDLARRLHRVEQEMLKHFKKVAGGGVGLFGSESLQTRPVAHLQPEIRKEAKFDSITHLICPCRIPRPSRDG